MALLVGAANVLGWTLAHAPSAAPEVLEPRPLQGLTYSPFGRHDDPELGRMPRGPSIDKDLTLLRTLTPKLRSYSASEWPTLPERVAAAGMRLTSGVWLGPDAARNRREVEAAIDAAQRSQVVDRVIVGNETQLHKTLPRAELIRTLDRLRAALRQPVSTAEPWHVWLADPQLARHVDFITVHLLPYWEGVPHARAVDHALMRLAELKRRFPGKPIVIGEFGWPSAGDPIPGVETSASGVLRKRPLQGNAAFEAHADPRIQAMVVREFVNRMAREAPGIEYFVIEAIDQPWKRRSEGAAGSHWGMLDAQRAAKFQFTGPVPASPWWPWQAAVATGLGVVLNALLGLALARLRTAALLGLSFGLQALVSVGVALALRPWAHYLEPLHWIVWGVLAALMTLLVLVFVTQLIEFAELFWRGQLRRTLGDKPWPMGRPLPSVCVHLACCNEPPDMVIATIDSLCRLEHRPLSIIVVDNNTRDARLWRPVQAHVEALQSCHGNDIQLHFVHLPEWRGYKAGALNFALAQTDLRADVIAVVDADYLVEPDWLRRQLGHFEDHAVAVVQSPQAHRGWEHQRFRRFMNWEYEGFFRIGMHHRHERDAIIQHGTVTLIRAKALRDAGGWDESCVCEDSELGLRLLDQGWKAVYVDTIAGRGLTPDDYAAYKAQRRRWAQGAVQILRRHAAALLLPGRLGLAQRYHYMAGWLPWLAAALHLVLTLVALAWSVVVVLWPMQRALPDAAHVVPTLLLPWLYLGMMPLLYPSRVRCGWRDTAGAMLAGMSLMHAVARGVIAGLLSRNARFVITRKGQTKAVPTASPAQGFASMLGPVREEAMLCIALMSAALVLASQHLGGVADVAMGVQISSNPDNTLAWIGMLIVQALPYAAALVCQTLSRMATAPQQTPMIDSDAEKAAHGQQLKA